MTKVAFDF